MSPLESIFSQSGMKSRTRDRSEYGSRLKILSVRDGFEMVIDSNSEGNRYVLPSGGIASAGINIYR